MSYFIRKLQILLCICLGKNDILLHGLKRPHGKRRIMHDLQCIGIHWTFIEFFCLDIQRIKQILKNEEYFKLSNDINRKKYSLVNKKIIL